MISDLLLSLLTVVTATTSAAPKYISASEAAAIDAELMAAPGFTMEQLTELAGLSVASAVFDVYPLHRRVLCVIGPGGNGGDGLVAARHLAVFGFAPTVIYPRRNSRPLFANLVAQLDMMRVPLLTAMPPAQALARDYDLVLDAVFGYSFVPPVRGSFVGLLASMRNSSLPIVAVDVPSGWPVDGVPEPDTTALKPATLVSLTVPKLCARHHAGVHFLGSRFVPPALASAHALGIPPFPGTNQAVLLHKRGRADARATDDARVEFAHGLTAVASLFAFGGLVTAALRYRHGMELRGLQ